MSAPIQLYGPYRRRSTLLRRARTALAWLAVAAGLLIGMPFTAGALSIWLQG